MVNVKKSLEDTNEIIEEFTRLVPGLTLAYKLLHAIWKKDNPEMTFADFNARLAKESVGVSAVSQDWLIERGWTLENGHWTPPGVAPTGNQ